MALIELQFTEKGLEQIDKVEIAIKRIQEFQPKDRIYKIPFSGGKDSLVVYTLACMAGVPFEAVHAPTIEFKETMEYIRKQFPNVQQVPPKRFSKRAKSKYQGKPKTMFNLIATHSFPPTRLHPYCCSDLKENVGEIGDILLTGVRWEESPSRKNRKLIEFFKGKTMIRPIIDWTEEEVWEFIHKYHLIYNPLYDQGFCRVGCPGCPKSKNQKKELEEYPEWRQWYLTAFKYMLENVTSENRTWHTPEDVMKWWLGECEKQRNEIDGQIQLCEFL